MVTIVNHRYVAIATPEPPHRLIGLRGFPLAERISDPRLKETPPVRGAGQPLPGLAAIATRACAELGLPALLLAGGVPRRPAWVVAAGHASLDGAEPLEPGHRWPVPGLTGLVTAIAVLRLAAEGRLDLDAPANGRLRSVRLADDCSWTARPPPAAEPGSTPSPCSAPASATTAPLSC